MAEPIAARSGMPGPVPVFSSRAVLALPTMTVDDLFRMVIRDWKRRSDRTEALTLNQIASVSIGKGTPRNAQRVGQMVHEYGEYFVWRSARKVRVNWKTVERDHPTILAPRAPRAAADRRRGPQFDEMLVALDDERRAIEKDARESPIRISNAVSRPDLDPSKPIYEFDLLLGDRDVPLSIPDGAPVRLRWSLSGGRKTSRHGVLLVQDLRRSKVVFVRGLQTWRPSSALDAGPKGGPSRGSTRKWLVGVAATPEGS